VAVIQLIGQGAFIVASLVLGVRLLLLWRRTKELPELTLGLSFMFGGGLGYVAWFVLGAATEQGADPATLHAIILTGLALTCVGAICNGLGIARIFRAEARWPLAMVASIAAVMAAGWVDYLLLGQGLGRMSFWVAMLAAAPIYVWGGIEAMVLAIALHKRAKLGLADPVIVNRLGQWSLAGWATVLMIGISFVARLAYGPVPVPWPAVLNALLGVVAAAAIWLGFFPPRALRERLVRAYAE